MDIVAERIGYGEQQAARGCEHSGETDSGHQPENDAAQLAACLDIHEHDIGRHHESEKSNEKQ
jgi:hypothetical protein